MSGVPESVKIRGCGGRVTTVWRRRSRITALDRRRYDRHVDALERELEETRRMLSERAESLAAIREVGESLARCSAEMRTLERTYRDGRVTLAGLTEAERRVYARVAGRPRVPLKQVADEIGIARRTVSFHLESIYRKLKVNGRHEL